MASIKEPLQLIKEIAAKFIPGAQILLFGSRARKDATVDSDYDILIISPQEFSTAEKLPLRTQIRKELLKSGIRSDILIQSHQEIEKKKELPGHIIRRILHEAIVI